MDDAMNKLIREQMRIIVVDANVPMDVGSIADKVADLELSKNDSDALYYAAGYLRACAESADVTVSELLENL